MEEQGIYFRTGGRLTHAGCEMLPGGQDIERIIIERIEFKNSESINGRVEEGVWLAHFAKNPYTTLPMILNATNRKRIAKLFPEANGYINLLKNIPVRLTKEKTRDVQDGGETYGLRISKIPAAEEKIVIKDLPEDKLDLVIAWAKKNNVPYEEVCKKYRMTDAVSAKLKAALNG